MQTNEAIKVPDMAKLTFKYDVMYLFEDRCEFRRFKKKPFGRILRDMFINVSHVMVLLNFVVVFVALSVTQLRTVWIIGWVIVMVIFYSFFAAIVTYYKQHRDVAILISVILRFHVIRNNRILRIEYFDGMLKNKIIDMPDTDAERRYIIDKLNKINISKSK
jgi:hypothetical protein